MKKAGGRGQGLGIKKTRLFLLLTLHLSLFTVLYGCASTKKSELPKVQMDATELNQRGVDAVSIGKYDKALIEFQSSLKLNASVDNQKGIAINLLNIGRLYLLMERFDDAKVAFDRGLKIGASLNDQLVLSEGYASLGRYYYLIGSNNDAVAVLEKAVAIDRRQSFHTIGNRLNIMGMVYKDMDKAEDAEKLFNEALKINKSYEMEADSADSFRGLGDILFKRGDYKKAGELYENALSIDKRLGISAKISIDLAALGMASLKQNDAGKALDFFLRAYAVDSRRGADKKALQNLDRIIEIYGSLGDNNNKEKYSLEKEKLLKKERDEKQ